MQGVYSTFAAFTPSVLWLFQAQGFKAAQEGPGQMQRLFAKHPENMQVCESCAWQRLPPSLANGKQI